MIEEFLAGCLSAVVNAPAPLRVDHLPLHQVINGPGSLLLKYSAGQLDPYKPGSPLASDSTLLLLRNVSKGRLESETVAGSITLSKVTGPPLGYLNELTAKLYGPVARRIDPGKSLALDDIKNQIHSLLAADQSRPISSPLMEIQHWLNTITVPGQKSDLLATAKVCYEALSPADAGWRRLSAAGVTEVRDLLATWWECLDSLWGNRGVEYPDSRMHNLLACTATIIASKAQDCLRRVWQEPARKHQL
jgi:hypothetical protein